MPNSPEPKRYKWTDDDPDVGNGQPQHITIETATGLPWLVGFIEDQCQCTLEPVELTTKQGFAHKMQDELERLTEQSDKWKVRALAAEAKLDTAVIDLEILTDGSNYPKHD